MGEEDSGWDLKVDFASVGQALSQHTNTLRTLCLDTLSEGVCFGPNCNSIGSLREFTKLRYLTTDDMLMTGNSWEKHFTTSDLIRAFDNFFPPAIKRFDLFIRRDLFLRERLTECLIAQAPATLEVLVRYGWVKGRSETDLVPGITDLLPDPSPRSNMANPFTSLYAGCYCNVVMAP